MKNAITFIFIFILTFTQGTSKAIGFNYLQREKWSGTYHAEAENRDGLKTSFDILINNLQNVSLVYVSDGENAETYKNLKAVTVTFDQIKIIFNKKYNNMGIIYLERRGKEYRLLGEPVSFINPGNESLTLKKLK